mgnify:CR=1 FL=1
MMWVGVIVEHQPVTTGPNTENRWYLRVIIDYCYYNYYYYYTPDGVLLLFPTDEQLVSELLLRHRGLGIGLLTTLSDSRIFTGAPWAGYNEFSSIKISPSYTLLSVGTPESFTAATLWPHLRLLQLQLKPGVNDAGASTDRRVDNAKIS